MMRRIWRTSYFLTLLLALLSFGRVKSQEAPSIQTESASTIETLATPLVLTTAMVTNVHPLDLNFQTGDLILSCDGDLYDEIIDFFADRKKQVEVSLQPIEAGFNDSPTILPIPVSIMFDQADLDGRTFYLNRPQKLMGPDYFFILQTGTKEIIEAIKAKIKIRSSWQIVFRILEEKGKGSR